MIGGMSYRVPYPHQQTIRRPIEPMTRCKFGPNTHQVSVDPHCPGCCVFQDARHLHQDCRDCGTSFVLDLEGAAHYDWQVARPAPNEASAPEKARRPSRMNVFATCAVLVLAYAIGTVASLVIRWMWGG